MGKQFELRQSTVLRMAGNIAAGLVPAMIEHNNELNDEHNNELNDDEGALTKAVATMSVNVAMAIVEEVERRIAVPKKGSDLVSIIINGIAVHGVSAEWVTYEDIVNLAGMAGTPSVICKTAFGGSSLTTYNTIKIESDMVFSVVHTGDA